MNLQVYLALGIIVINCQLLIISSYQISKEENEENLKFLHKIKKLKKKQFLQCLLSVGNHGRYNNPSYKEEGRFFFPIVQQQTGVHINGYPTSSGYPASSYGGGMSNNNCDHILGNPIGSLGLGHPLLGGILSGSGMHQEESTDDNDNRRKFISPINIKRHVIRPIYKSMKTFYKLF